KSLQLMINGLTAFSVKPLRIATVMGLLFSAIGFIFGLVTIIRKIIHVNTVLGYSSLMAVLLFVGGLILLMLGLIGEYLGRIYICINASPQYIIKETVNCSPAPGNKEQ
ncbi:MAG: glycosyltransferase, partial [Lachnospiraceae bacterium]|nr:glycosyltransferase [Lachnospiraceae bacterium]